VDDELPKRIGSYVLLELLGRGSFSVVYRAQHEPSGREVALKLLHTSGVDEGARARFLREAGIASRLVDPAIPEILEIGVCDGCDFIAMDLVRGASLDRLLAEGRTLSVETVVDVGVQLARVLSVAHATGIVHRDIKPANLVLTDEGRMKLLDFGLSHVVGVQSISQPGALIGTVPYMSPEQLLGEAVDERSDVYSASAVLYELLGGVRPSTGDRFETITHAILNVPPARLRTLGREVPETVERVVFMGLAKRASERYQTAGDMLHDWEVLSLGARSFAGESLPLLAPASVLDEPLARDYTAVVGREAEVDRLVSALKRASRGLDLFLLTGEAGAGKTRLMEEAAARFGSSTARFLRVRCNRDHPLPYELWGDVIEAGLQAEGHDRSLGPEMRGLPGTLSPFLLERVPRLARLAPELSPRSGSPEPDGVRALWEGLTQALQRVAATGTTVLLVDDLQWADEESLGFFSHLAARAATVPFRVVATLRAEAAEASGVASLLAAFRREDRLLEIPVGRLGSRDVAELVRLRFGSSEELPALAERILAESDGNALYVVETLKLLEARHEIERAPSGWRITGDLERLPIPQKVADLIEQRLQSVDGDDREVLEVGAVIGEAFSAKIVADCLGSPTLQVLRRARRLQEPHGVLTSTEEGFRFAHSKIRDYLVDHLPHELLREHHRAIGSALARIHTSGDDHAMEIGDHLERGGEALAAVPHLERGADRAFRLYANALALHTYERARAILEDRPSGERVEERCRLGRKIAIVEIRLGRFAEGALNASLSLRLAKRLTDPSEAGELALALAEARYAQGESEAALTAAAQARDAFLAVSNHEGIARAADLEGITRQRQGVLDEALRCFQEALALREGLSLAADVARSRIRIGSIFRHLHRTDECITELERARIELEASGDRIAAANACGELGNAYIGLNDYDHAAAQYAASIEHLQPTGDVLRLSRAFLNAASAELFRGDVSRALSLYRDALKLRLQLGNRGDIGTAQVNLAHVYLLQARFRDAILASHDGVEMFSGLDTDWRLGSAHAVSGQVHNELGAFDHALRSWELARDIQGRAGRSEDRLVSVVGAAVARAGLGDIGEAERELDGVRGDAISPAARCDLLLAEIAIRRLREGPTSAAFLQRAEELSGDLVDFLRRSRLAVEWLSLAAASAGPERERARARYAAIVDLVTRARLRGMEIRVRLAGARLAAGSDAAIESLRLALGAGDSVWSDVPPKFRASWAERSGYFEAARELLRCAHEAGERTLQEEAEQRLALLSAASSIHGAEPKTKEEIRTNETGRGAPRSRSAPNMDGQNE